MLARKIGPFSRAFRAMRLRADLLRERFVRDQDPPDPEPARSDETVAILVVVGLDLVGADGALRGGSFAQLLLHRLAQNLAHAIAHLRGLGQAAALALLLEKQLRHEHAIDERFANLLR